MSKICDNHSVGFIVTDPQRGVLLFERATFPIGVAPVAGHIDSHGTAVDAAKIEVAEELGLTVTSVALLTERWMPNKCRRQPGSLGTGHLWTVYTGGAYGDLNPSARETRNTRWYSTDELWALACRTVAFASGEIDAADWNTSPGLEPVWVLLLTDYLALPMTAAQHLAVLALAAGDSPA